MKGNKASSGFTPDGEMPGGAEPSDKAPEGTAPEAVQASDPNQWLAYLNLGWMIVANMALCVGLGLWLDTKFRTAPWLLLTGLVLAFAACGITIWLAVKRLESAERKKPRHTGLKPGP